MSNNVQIPSALPYESQTDQSSDPQYLYKKLDYSPPKRFGIPKVLIPFFVAGLAVIAAFVLAPPERIHWLTPRLHRTAYYISILGVGVIVLALTCVWLKKRLLASIPEDIKLTPISANTFPNLDINELERYTTEMQALGFIWRLDFTTKTAKRDYPSGFARLMVHPAHKCIAEINQIKSNQGVLSVRCVFMNYAISESAKIPVAEWVQSTTNREPTAVGYAYRLPYGYLISVPEVGPAQLLQIHLDRRNEIVNQTKREMSEDLSTPTFFALIEKSILDRKALLKKRNILGFLFEVDRFRFRPQMEWSGDYTKSAEPSES